MVRIAVASMPLTYGADVTPDKVKFVQYPATSLPPGTYSRWPSFCRRASAASRFARSRSTSRCSPPIFR
jgi:Flp pilus assembly protein CpaB